MVICRQIFFHSATYFERFFFHKVWKLLARIAITADDIEEVDFLFMQSLRGIRNIQESGVTEENFHEVGF